LIVVVKGEKFGVLNHGRMIKEISMKEVAQTNTTY